MSLFDEEDVLDALKFIVSHFSKNWIRKEMLLPYSIDFVTFSKENYVIKKTEKEDGYLCDVFLNPAYLYKYTSGN